MVTNNIKTSYIRNRQWQKTLILEIVGRCWHAIITHFHWFNQIKWQYFNKPVCTSLNWLKLTLKILLTFFDQEEQNLGDSEQFSHHSQWGSTVRQCLNFVLHKVCPDVMSITPILWENIIYWDNNIFSDLHYVGPNWR